VPNGVQARWLYGGNHTVDQTHLVEEAVMVLVAEQGWVDKEKPGPDTFQEVPLLLDSGSGRACRPTAKATVAVCKSEHSECFALDPGYACKCKHGYDGNPYLAGGCQG
jgi:hypothetical protein